MGMSFVLYSKHHTFAVTEADCFAFSALESAATSCLTAFRSSFFISPPPPLLMLFAKHKQPNKRSFFFFFFFFLLTTFLFWKANLTCLCPGFWPWTNGGCHCKSTCSVCLKSPDCVSLSFPFCLFFFFRSLCVCVCVCFSVFLLAVANRIAIASLSLSSLACLFLLLLFVPPSSFLPTQFRTPPPSLLVHFLFFFPCTKSATNSRGAELSARQGAPIHPTLSNSEGWRHCCRFCCCCHVGPELASPSPPISCAFSSTCFPSSTCSW